MANDIGVGRYNRLLQRLLQLKGDAPAPLLAPTIVPSIVLESDEPEFAYLSGSRLCIGYGSLAAGGAGFRSQVMLVNPQGSGVLATVESIWIMQTALDVSIRLFVPTTGFSGQTQRMRDTRLGSASSACSCFGKNNSALVAGVLVGAFRSDMAPFTGAFVISPGQTLTLDPSADNTQITVTFVWRERALEDSET